MTTILEVDKLIKHFPIAGTKARVQAVNGITFRIDQGETLGLVGESGSGKTTVGRCILGLIAATDGTIRFRGRDISAGRAAHGRDLRGRVQLVFQEPAEALDPRQRIGASIEEPLIAQRIEASERRPRVLNAIDTVGLVREILELYPAELSAGQQQRVGIARAMITEPDLVVLDEPTSALDPTARAEIIELLRSIQRERGTSYLFISHDLSTVRFVSHRVAVMYLGMIVEQGDAAEVFAMPRHPYSVGLLSSVLLPNPRIKVAQDITLAGEIPSPINLPKGCFLASRCPFAIDRCRDRIPPAADLGNGHLVHCIRHEDVAKRERPIDAFAQFQREAERILGVQPEIPASREPAGQES